MLDGNQGDLPHPCKYCLKDPLGLHLQFFFFECGVLCNSSCAYCLLQHSSFMTGQEESLDETILCFTWRLNELTCAHECAVTVLSWCSTFEGLVELWDTFNCETFQPGRECDREQPRSWSGFAGRRQPGFTENMTNIGLCHVRLNFSWRRKKRFVRSLAEDVEDYFNVNNLWPAYQTLMKHLMYCLKNTPTLYIFLFICSWSDWWSVNVIMVLCFTFICFLHELTILLPHRRTNSSNFLIFYGLKHFKEHFSSFSPLLYTSPVHILIYNYTFINCSIYSCFSSLF